MQILADIIPPHEVQDADKLASLVAAYRSGEDVTEIVVIRYVDDFLDIETLAAICGSHRIAAMLVVFGEDADIADLPIIVIDRSELPDSDDLTHQEELIMDRLEVWGDFDVIVNTFRTYLPASVQVALEGQ